jgi:glycosyltransferase involved in cell wall biosynthesis
LTRLVLHAPGVHTGGGLVLLQNLLAAPGLPLAWANLDSRALEHVRLPRNAAVNAVEPRLLSRLRAEMALPGASSANSVVLCFHGLPPLLRPSGKVVVFLQNRNYLGLDPASTFDGRTRWRLPLERRLSALFKRNVDEYVVQTPYMARATRAWHGGEPRIRIIPYLDAEPPVARAHLPKHDFIYVADGEAHKNHRVLLEAWALLAEGGLRPSLAVTLDGHYRDLLAEIDATRARHELRVENLGMLSRKKLGEAYGASGALVYPSISESFGLPLVEASRNGLPIIASELDYVRDVCDPVQTFDPASATSIARAVRRYLQLPEPRVSVRSGGEFVRELLD